MISKHHFIIILTFLLSSCSPSTRKIYYYEGSVMGTTYHIKVVSSHPLNASSLDSVLFYVDTLLTTYSERSELMRINLAAPGTIKVSNDFAYVFSVAHRIWEESGGAFDPTVGPLAWKHGFGPAFKFDTIITGLEYFDLLNTDSGFLVIKDRADVYLDFGGIAKGYGVDKVAWFLLENGYTNFMIEVGGEVRINGTKPDGKPWKIGIENPFKIDEYIYIISDTNISIATSGTYRQRIRKSGYEITHIVSVDKKNRMSSDVILASFMDTSCTYADGWATALVAMGCQRAKQIIQNREFRNVIILCADSTFTVKVKGEFKDVYEVP